MARRPSPGKCVHCLADPVERNWDHVFPKSWYPEGFPLDEYKWQAPSCISCNSKLGALEEDFLRRVALCLDHNAPASVGIVEKPLRSVNPSSATNDKERKIRETLRQRVVGDALYGDEIPDDSTIPGMGERWGRERKDQIAIPIPAESFERLTEKIVRGLFYVVDQKFIEPPFTVDVHVSELCRDPFIKMVLERFSVTYSRKPGLIIRRALADDGVSSVLEIQFWQQFKTYAFVSKETA